MPRRDSPFVVLVLFDRYTGPDCFDEQHLNGVVPIFHLPETFSKVLQAAPAYSSLSLLHTRSPYIRLRVQRSRRLSWISQRRLSARAHLYGCFQGQDHPGYYVDTPFDLEALRIRPGDNHRYRIEDIRRRRSQHIQRGALLPGKELCDEELYD